MSDDETVHVIDVTINGEPHRRTVLARQLLVYFIREAAGLTGTHVGCDTGNCGACTVIVDGRPTKSCMMLAVQADGCAIETVEGLAPRGGELSGLQEAFHKAHALQCGYCTPGFLMSAVALLRDNADPTEAEIRRALKGNLCRCTGYMNIVAAVRAAAEGEGVQA